MAQARKWFLLTGVDGEPPKLGSVYVATEDAITFRAAVVASCFRSLAGVTPDELLVFSSQQAYDSKNARSLDAAADIAAFGNMSKKALVVVAPPKPTIVEPPSPTVVTLPPSPPPLPTDTTLSLGWLQQTGIDSNWQGVTMSNPKTLFRERLLCRMINQLHSSKVLLVKAPPMTGKTALATLVCRELTMRSQKKHSRVIVAGINPLGVGFQGFDEFFTLQCGMEWAAFTKKPEEGCTVYLVIDEAQILYKPYEDSAPRRFDCLWRQVKHVLDTPALPMHVLLFAPYDAPLQDAELATPFRIPPQWGIQKINFDRDEILEYVTKWFDGIESLGKDASRFCELLYTMTGGHVGLCTATIRFLNDMMRRWQRESFTSSTWLQLLSTRLITNGRHLFKQLESTRAIASFRKLGEETIASLERLVMGGTLSIQDDAALSKLVHVGILVPVGDEGLAPHQQQYEFSSPVVWFSFVKWQYRCVQPTAACPLTLHEFVLKCVRAIDLKSVHKTIGRSATIDKRTWLIEFSKVAYLWKWNFVSMAPDVGSLRGSVRWIDFIVRNHDQLWGIDFLTEADCLAERVGRFAPGGYYSAMQLTDHCLLYFRPVESIDTTTRDDIAREFGTAKELFVVCYDRDLAHVVLFHGEEEVDLLNEK